MIDAKAIFQKNYVQCALYECYTLTRCYYEFTAARLEGRPINPSPIVLPLCSAHVRACGRAIGSPAITTLDIRVKYANTLKRNATSPQ